MRRIAVAVVLLVAAVACFGSPANAVLKPLAAQPATDCYHSVWTDPADTAQLDVASYGALFDCTTSRWSFGVATYSAWADSSLGVYDIYLGGPLAGCGGVDWILQASYQSGAFVSQLVRTASCSSSIVVGGSGAAVSRASNGALYVSISNAKIGSQATLQWYGSLTAVGALTNDRFPGVGNSPNFHTEAGYVGACAVLPSGSVRSGAIVDQPTRAVGALRTSAFGASERGRDTVDITGDPLEAGFVLARAGLTATIAHVHTETLAAVPNDPGYASQWPLTTVGATTAWATTHGSSTLVVADVDTGVDATHPDLVNKLVTGWDSATNSALPAGNSDLDGHGTEVAGVIGAETNNGTGLASLGWDTKIMPIRAQDSMGQLLNTSVAAGIDWARAHGAKVINLSLGSPCGDQLINTAVANAQAANILVVASAGNDQLTGNHVIYPAALPGVVAVAATGFTGMQAAYSSSGTYVSIAAPGGSNDGNAAHDIPLLAMGGGTTTAAGTSFAAPLVSAAAALVMAVRPDLSASSVGALLEATAAPVSGGDAQVYGAGILDAGAAIAAAERPGAPSGVVAVGGNGQATVSWTAPTINGGAITGYTVSASPGPASATVAGSQTSAVVGGLAGGTSYSFTVTATNSFGTGPASAPSASVTIPSPPSAPTAVVATAGFAEASISWAAAAANGSAIVGYSAVASPGGQMVAVAGNVTSARFVGLDTSTTYTFRVTATNGLGAGPPSAPSNGVVPKPPRAAPDTYVTALANAVSIKATPSGRGLLVLASDGTVRSVGDGPAFASVPLAHPAVTLTVTPTDLGYRIFDTHGCPTYFGDAAHFTQDICSTALNGPVLDGATRPQGDGYWLVASDGGVFAFGGAPFAGSMGGQPLNGPVVGMAAASDGSGYWEVATDGGIFSFGVPFLGSMGGTPLNKPVVGMVASGTGYMMVAADGGVFNFGNPFFGSLGGATLPHPIASIAPSYDAFGQPNGYWMLDSAGTIYAFGSAWLP